MPPGTRGRRSSPMPRRPPRRSMARSARPQTRRRPSATGAATRWTPRTRARRAEGSRRASPRGRGGAAAHVPEGPAMLLVKPALPSLDILARARAHHALPIGAYQVSGEYALVKAAAERGWVDERRVVMESLVSIVRAGADFVITYAAADVAAWLRDDDR